MLLLVLLPVLPAAAQLGAGQIEGTVTDPSDALVSGAKITITNTATGVSRELTSDSGGRYRAVALEPGPYTVKVEATGFAPLERKGVDVVVGSTATVNLKLRVAGAGETVVVEDAAPLVPTESTEVSNLVSKEVVENVPSIGRRWDNYVLLAPGVQPDGSFGLISYRGISGLYNNNTVDGADNNQAFFSEARGRTRAVYTYSQSAVKEFQVSLSNFSAESGRAAGGLVNAVTKSGTNSIHGEAFYFIRDSAVGASDPFAAATALRITGDPKLPERRQQYGFSLGGPVVKDKVFWFLNYDEQHRSFPYVVSISGTPVATSPTATSFFGTGFNGDCTTLPTANQVATCQFFQGETTVVPRKGLNNVALGKLDWVVSQNHNLSFSYNYHQWRGVNGIRTPLINFNAASDNGMDRVRTDSFNARWNWVISPTLLNEVRFQFARDNESQVPNAPGPGTSVTNGFTFGQPDFLPRPKYPYEDRYQWTNNLSWIHGRHTFKFGADINYVRETQINLFQGGGVYSYTGSTAFANLAGDCPEGAVVFGCMSDAVDNFNTYTQAFDLRVTGGSLAPELSGSAFFTTTDWNFYAQDTFKIRPNLTLNLGVRYEYQHLPQPSEGNPLLPLTQSIPQDTNNFAPRLGISWDVGGNQKTVFHAGYGLIYGRTSNSAIAQALLNNGVIVRSLSFTVAQATALPDPLTYPNCFMPGVSGTTCAVATPAGTGFPPDVSQFAADFQRPMVHQAEVSLEHEIFSDTVLRLTYAHSGGRRLPAYRDVNLFPPAAEVFLFLQNDLVANGETLASAGLFGPFPFYCNGVSFCGSQVGARPDTVNFRRIIQAESVVNSSYDALIVQLRRRMKRGLLFDAHFTWSKALDNGQNSLTFFGRSNTVFDPLNPSLDRGLSDFHVRRRFVTSFVWRPDDTFPIGNQTARAIFGRWQLSGAVTAQDRPPINGTLSGFLSTTATGAVDGGSANGTGGNFRVPFLARNFGEGPGFAIFDFRIAKSIPITEGTRLELIAESFNLLNRVNITSVNTTAMALCTAPTGTIVFPGSPPPTCPTIDNPALPPPAGLAIPSNFIVNNSNASLTDNNCGGTVLPDGTRCVMAISPTDYLLPRSASSTLNGMRDVQFAVKFHW
jgi:hypothetical protein